MPFAIKIDESELDESQRAFHEEWAKNLDVSIEELFKRLLLAAIDGDPFIEKRPHVETHRKPEIPS
jgi:hypothetical protein